MARAIVGIEVDLVPREDQDSVLECRCPHLLGYGAQIAIDNATYRVAIDQEGAAAIPAKLLNDIQRPR
jgi:hypothetical protein